MRGADGRLSLEFNYDAKSACTLLEVREQRQPLKVVRAFQLPRGGALVHLHNLSGGVLAGDRLSVDMALGPGTAAQITSTGATRVYRSAPGSSLAQSFTRARIAENALLEYLPDPLIPFAGARYCQRTVIDLDNGAGLFWWETLAPGRAARGEVFSYEALRLELDLHAGGMPIALERSDLNPALRPLDSLARMGNYRYLATLYVCRVGTERAAWLDIEKQLLDLAQSLSTPVIIWSLTRLPAHGLVVRALSQNGRDVSRGLIAFWRTAKKALYGQEAVMPRKIY